MRTSGRRGRLGNAVRGVVPDSYVIDIFANGEILAGSDVRKGGGVDRTGYGDGLRMQDGLGAVRGWTATSSVQGGIIAYSGIDAFFIFYATSADGDRATTYASGASTDSGGDHQGIDQATPAYGKREEHLGGDAVDGPTRKRVRPGCGKS